MDISYATFRKVLSTLLRNDQLRDGLTDLLAGNELELSEVGFLDLLEASNVDIDILRILTGREPEDIGPEQAAEAFTAFFSAVRGSWHAFQPLLESLGYTAQVEAGTATGECASTSP